MSHFTVLVVGDDVNKQLAPFHEFESTGLDDEYVQDIDITEKARKEYEKQTILVLKDSEGNIHDAYDKKFLRPLTEEEKEGKFFPSQTIRYVPEGYTEERVPTKERESFLEFVDSWYGYHGLIKQGEKPDLEGRHKYSYVIIDDNNEVISVIKRTNPNAKWDWYQMGGRWNGFFKLKPTKLIQKTSEIQEKIGLTSEDLYGFVELKKNNPDKFEKALENLGVEKGLDVAAKVQEWATEIYPERPVGSPGIFGSVRENYTGYADQAYKYEIDIQGMRDEAENAARKRYKRLQYFFGGEIPKIETWKDVLKHEEMTIEERRDFYWKQNPLIELKKVKEIDETKELGFSEEEIKEIIWERLDDFQCSEEEYVEVAKKSAFSTFAFVKDSKWFEQGEMGWFAIVTNEKDENQWINEFNKMIDSLPDNTLLTLIDCHI